MTEHSSQDSIPNQEVATIAFWKENQIYEKSLAKRQGCQPFVFYEGPPTANGLPHPGHCLTRAIKDLYPRYKTMRGFLCERKAGWDTHGLPVEVEVCKEIGIHSKEEIEKYGVEPFIHKCLESVFRYTKEWEELTQRLGFWINLEAAYVTYHQSFVESVWWSLKTLFDRGLLFQGHKIVWWWSQGGTALSSGEVGQGYRQVADPSVFVRFPLIEDVETDLLVWTTTPWTLPSNQFAAVNPNLEYAVVSLVDENGVKDARKIIVASALIEMIAGKVKKTAILEQTMSGKELIGKRYIPPFDYYYKTLGEKQGTLLDGDKEHVGWRIVAADFVTTESGTGLVHEAPAFGEVDFEVLQKENARFQVGEGPELICAVGPDGKFTEDVPDYQGHWVKSADKDICRNMKERGLLFLLEQYLHDYPFCWRAEQDPLIQYPRKSWFIRTSSFKEEMLKNNEQINWLPEHIKEGRFGNFLASNVDWALSRERYWGTPLPIWVCEESGKMEAIGSYDELLAKPGVSGMDVWEDAKKTNPKLLDDLKVHKPYIDAITYDSPFVRGKRMRRVSEVIDCWYDSGSMPFAQWGYPNKAGSDAIFKRNFPADFISEALDQTRGWFYSQHAISSLLFGGPAFKNCIVLGLMLGEDGQKMSKSKRNYREPREIFDKYGADALRWYFFANQTPWTSIRYSEQAIRESMPEFLLRLGNVVSFYEVYKGIDQFDPETSAQPRPIQERAELDRWILSELNLTNQLVIESMDKYDHFAACSKLTEFVDSLSNWYVRRSRDRFWSAMDSPDEVVQSKIDAYFTLYEVLVKTAKLIAPFVPFLAERMWSQLVDRTEQEESVHLCDYPVPDVSVIDVALSERMRLMRELVSLGRNARMNAKLKVRQPLARIEVVLAEKTYLDWLREHVDLIQEELNVKSVEFVEKADQYISYTVLPDLKKLGPKLGKRLPEVKKYLGEVDGGKLLAEMEQTGKVVLPLLGEPIELTSEEIQIRLQAKEGWAAAQGADCVVVLSTELTEELLAEGRARELVRMIQDRRKELGCEYTDRIRVEVSTCSEEIIGAIELFGSYIRGETLCSSLELTATPEKEAVPQKIDNASLHLTVKTEES
ncbi:MAG: isoleucine--tRNA ligase [Thermoguttaceae bacterium]